jgi:acyl transferase domain-containing protein
VLKLGYATEKKQGKVMSKYGYKIDNDLSNDNQQVYYNPEKKKLLMNVTGTHNLKDIITDTRLALGGIKNTERFKSAENTLQKAKDKYNENKVVLTGHSLGATISNYIKKPDDELYALNAGYTIGQPTRNKGGNAHNYRVAGDVVSLLGANATNMTTLKSPYKIYDPLKVHSTDAIKDQMIFI